MDKVELRLQRNLGVQPPVFVMLSLLSVKGYRIAYGGPWVDEEDFDAIDRDSLIVPEVMIDNLDLSREGIQRAMKQVFDPIWNACGFEGSRLYDSEGRWTGERSY